MLLEVKEFPSRDFTGIYTATITHLQHNFPTLGAAFPRQATFSTVVSNIRKATLPPQPTLDNLHLLHVPPPFNRTIGTIGDGAGGGMRFCLHIQAFQQLVGGVSHIAIFGSWACFKRLCESDAAYMDGTFHVAPVPYHQLFIIHFLYGEKMIPCLYVFLTRKTKETYMYLFEWIRDRAVQKGHPLRWERIR
jgi:hypothetical protein